MKQKFAWIGLAFLCVVTTLAFSQDGTPQPCPDVEPGALGCEPVAWSRLQEPMPLPEPDAKPAPPADQQTGRSSNSPTQTQTPKQSISGVVVRKGEKYVLKAGDNTTYQLYDQSRAAQYQDKQVKVVGTLDADSNTLHIESHRTDVLILPRVGSPRPWLYECISAKQMRNNKCGTKNYDFRNFP